MKWILRGISTKMLKYLDLREALPQGRDIVLVATSDGTGFKVHQVLLPHQITPEILQRIRDSISHPPKEWVLIPVRSAEYIFLPPEILREAGV